MMNSASGSFQSPNYPSNYPNSEYCVYQIAVPANLDIKLRIDRIDLEPHSACDYDELAIYDGSSKSASKIGSLCGNSANGREFISSGNNLYVVFKSDGSGTYSGFQATYSTITHSEFASSVLISMQLSTLVSNA